MPEQKESSTFSIENPEWFYDACIIGGGPAGLTAALYLARAQYRVLVLEKDKFGGQITITDEVVNYPGVLQSSGHALSETMRQQAERFGAEFRIAEVDQLELDGPVKIVHSSGGRIYALGVLIATGANPRRVGFMGEDEFQGRGVAYCATCDGEFFSGRPVLVVGGGFAAAEEAVFLTKYASEVTVLVRRDAFRCAADAAERCLKHPKIKVRFNTEIVEVSGQGSLASATLRNNKSGETELYHAPDGGNFGVFVFAGYEPASALLRGTPVEMDAHGYVVTDRNQATNVNGVYAAGDICIKELRQVVTAVADGAIAATQLEKHAASMQTELGVRPERPQELRERVEAFRARGKSGAGEGDGKVASGVESASPADSSGAFLDAAVREQLAAVGQRLGSELILRVYKDERPVSVELEAMLREMAEVCPKLQVELVGSDADLDLVPGEERPLVRIVHADGQYSGLAFHGAPGGHEFQSFVIALYNVAGPGQPVDEEVRKRAEALPETKLQILVSLSCTQCPDLVMAVQRIASLNSSVTAEVYDINHFEALKDRYQVMSVPCLIINDGARVSFGKKNARQVLDLIEAL